MTDIWITLSKKKNSNSSTIMIPAKKTNNTTSSAQTATTTTAQPKTIKPPKVKAHKVKQHKAQPHQKQQAPQLNLSDFNVATSGDANGIYINILYQSQPIYRFTLPKYDFDNWQRMDSNQKLQYVTVRVHTNANAFGNDMRVVQPVIMSIYQILNNIFAEAQKIRAQQARRGMI